MSDKVTRSTGNVFADLGLDEADVALAKAKLAAQIAGIIERRGLTQAKAATVLGVDQPKVSALVRGRLTSFSTERLIRFLNALGSDVEIVVHRNVRSRSHGRTIVVAG
jgi:predicted XRE-type DNA-binding protein